MDILIFIEVNQPTTGRDEMNLFAKGDPLNPMTEKEKVSIDTRTYSEKVADDKAAHGICEMGDEELHALFISLTSSDELMMAVSHEVRIRKNARDTRTIAEKYMDAPASIWN
jgi:hypothetical protein